MAEKSRSSMLQEAEPVSEPLSGQLFAEMRARQEGDLQYLMVTWAVLDGIQFWIWGFWMAFGESNGRIWGRTRRQDSPWTSQNGWNFNDLIQN